jgi:hypothetical protein
MFPVMLFAQGEFVVNLNITDGTYMQIGTAIQGVEYIYPNDCTYDEDNHVFIFPSATPQQRLFSIDVSTNSIVYNPLYSDFNYFEYDKNSDKLYGILCESSLNVKQLVEINQLTGASTSVSATFSDAAIFSSDFHTIDILNGKYYFVDPNNNLYSISLSNGVILSNPALSFLSGESLICIEVNNTTGILYGLLQDTNNSLFYLVIIDSATGVITKIGSGSAYGSGNGSCAIDELNDYFVYLYSDGLLGYLVTSLSLSSGNVVYNSLIESFPTQNNYYSLVCDNSTSEFYCLHWDYSDSEYENISDDNEVPEVYPNPASNNIVVKTFVQGEKSIELYDNIGKKVYDLTSEEIELVINIEYLKPGMYFLRLTTNNESFIYDFIKQ